VPTPLIELQRRLTLVGAIRAGGEKPERGVGRKLDAWRITSPRKALVEQAATLYGGEVTEWTSPVGQEWQVYTALDELPVLLMPAFSLRQSYELWEGATKRTRLCDGVDEELSGGPCICNRDGDDRCDLYTRLVVALPELDTLLGWRVITRGANAAHELPTMVAAAQMTSGGKQFVPARLRLDQRRGVVDGQVARFVVPTLDLGVGYAALAASPAGDQPLSLPAGSTAVRHEQSVEQALDAASVSPRSEGRRRAAAFGDTDDIDTDDVRAPGVPDPDGSTTQSPTSEVEKPEEAGTGWPSKEMKTKLNVLVGQLRGAGHITTDGLYLAIEKLRGQAGLDLAIEVGGYDDDHVLHWSPLRDALTRSEAHQLIEWLSEKERRVAAGTTAGGGTASPGGTPEQSSFPIPEGVRDELAERERW
jgi:hypothetical protein